MRLLLELARHSEVSIATVKRLESGVHVQNKSIDQVISSALDQQKDVRDYVPLVSYTIRQHQQQSESRSVWCALGQEKVTSSRMEFSESVIYA